MSVHSHDRAVVRDHRPWTAAVMTANGRGHNRGQFTSMCNPPRTSLDTHYSSDFLPSPAMSRGPFGSLLDLRGSYSRDSTLTTFKEVRCLSACRACPSTHLSGLRPSKPRAEPGRLSRSIAISVEPSTQEIQPANQLSDRRKFHVIICGLMVG